MPVKVENMDMPRNCNHCPFIKGFFDDETWQIVYKCGLLAFKEIDIKKRKRPDFCLLKECK